MKPRIFQAISQLEDLVRSLRHLGPGLTYLVMVILIVIFIAPPALLNLPRGWYWNGVTTLSLASWELLFMSHVFSRHTVRYLGDETEVQHNGLVSALVAIFVTIMFYLIGLPLLNLIVLSTVQVAVFFIRGSYQQEARYIVPFLTNSSLVVLGVWILWVS